MASFNKIILVGYLGQDPTIRYMPNGDAVCSFSVATTERRKDQAGEFQDQTTWFRVTIWGKRGETANQYLTKGKQLYVEGRLRTNEYTAQDGTRRTTLEVTATDFHFLGAKGDEFGGGGTSAAPSSQSGGQTKPAARPQPAADQHDDAPPNDDEIPF